MKIKAKGKSKKEKGWKKSLKEFYLTFSFFLLPFTFSLTVSAFSLPKEAVHPRIFTPNGDGVNAAVYFDVANPSLDSLEGTIYDVGGNPVADMKRVMDVSPSLISSLPLQPDALVWDGRDRDGRVVRSGIYIYEVRGGGASVTGTVVVAK